MLTNMFDGTLWNYTKFYLRRTFLSFKRCVYREVFVGDIIFWVLSLRSNQKLK